MIISVWRYSHLFLAVSSFLLLTLASVTGVILAIEPVKERVTQSPVSGADTMTLSRVIPLAKKQVPGIQELRKDEFGRFVVSFTDKEGKNQLAFFNPVKGELTGQVSPRSPFFEWVTALHRSLFLHEAGRIIMGVTAFLLLLIAVTGIALVVQRQKGFRRFFAPIEKTEFAPYYHTVLGRFSLLFILAIALTGMGITFSRQFIQPDSLGEKVREEDLVEEPALAPEAFPFFRQTTLGDVESVQFPFSDFPEDYYTIKVKGQQVCINQFTGSVLAAERFGSAKAIQRFSLDWHTGRTSIVWALVLGIAAIHILFFIFSGLAIAWKRIRSKSGNQFLPEDCRIILLVGSENGSTYSFASAVYRQLLSHGEKVYLGDLDTYRLYPKAEYLVVMTSTYGEGDPPSNGKHFLKKLALLSQQQPINFSVVGFGSRSYARYCQYATDVHLSLAKQPWARPMQEPVMVNDRSPQDFSQWLTSFTTQTGFSLVMPRNVLAAHQKGLRSMEVVERTPTDVDNVFLLQLKVPGFRKFASGDLLAVYPKQDHRERLYSIGKVNDSLLLSIKLHENGLGSSFLNGLQKGDRVAGRIVKNEHFHFPAKASSLVMIANGTGIAPFLGMLSENNRQLPAYLYAGFRTRASFRLYESILQNHLSNEQLSRYSLALSREEERLYVSHLLKQDHEFLVEQLKNGAVVMICGSLSMQKDVLAVLESVCAHPQLSSLDQLLASGRVRTDCY